MNKVISVEIAKQVFWIDEDAFQNLQHYLANIKAQLANDECAEEIYQDIELRVAELLYGFSPSDQQAITNQQLDEVIEQVGFIDQNGLGEQWNAQDDATNIHNNKKSYLDPSNKIIAGVCSGLSIRFKVPAIVLRLVFIALIMLFGLGAALYVIFWISLETNNTRNTALAAAGKARTAQQLASAQVPTESAAMTIQRILFLPFSIVGTLINIVSGHFQTRKSTYAWILKNVFAVCLFAIGLMLFIGMLEFNSNHFFRRFFAWILGFAVTYLLVLALVIYIKEYYLQKPRTKVDIKLKLGAILPGIILVYAVYSLHISQNEHVTEVVSQHYELEAENLEIVFQNEHENGVDNHSQPSDRISFYLRTSDSQDAKLNVQLEYFARGRNIEKARENINAIDYAYDFDNGVLTINTDWLLNPGYYRRGQSVNVIVSIPSGTVLTSNRPFSINPYNEPTEYVLAYTNDSSQFEYFTSQEYLHEWSKDYPNKLSENELYVLQSKFCDEFFIGESWACSNNIYRKVVDNYRFDKAFNEDISKIDEIRNFLQADRSLFVSHLDKIHELQSSISVQYKVKSDFETYIEHLQKTKAAHVEYIVVNQL